MPLPAATLDAMLKATGKPVVFGGVVPDPPVYGKLREEPLLEADGQGYGVAGTRTTLHIRDGVQPADLAEDDPLTWNGEPYRVRDVGCRNADGTRTLTLVRS